MTTEEDISETFHISHGIVPITIEEAHHLYEIATDADDVVTCSCCVSLQAPRIWWKSFGVDSGFYTFCQKCYHENRLTAPDGKTFGPDELEPAYISGHQCSCDGGDRSSITKFDRGEFTISIHHLEKKIKETGSRFLMDELVDDVGDVCEDFENVIYIPDVLPTVSIVMTYSATDLGLINTAARISVYKNGAVISVLRTMETGFGEFEIRDLNVGEYTIKMRFYNLVPNFVITAMPVKVFEFKIMRMSKKPVILGDQTEIPDKIEI